MKIQIPWPDRRLSPNARLSWHAKLAAKAEARLAGFCAAREVFTPGEDSPLTGALRVTYRIHPPSHRRYDQDNLLASMKAEIDGVCDGLGIDDVQFRETVIRWGDVEAGGRVEMEIEEL